MNNDAERIRTALDRRFSRVPVPACPATAWQYVAPEPATIRPRGIRRRFAYSAAVLAAVAVAGLSAQASTVIKQTYQNIVGPHFLNVSSKPLPPLIHASERLTVAQAQRHVAFPIVEPAGLPAPAQFLYAHIVRDSVVLNYQWHFEGQYYRIAITEATVMHGPAVAHFEVRMPGQPTKRWTEPVRRWKHGALFMQMLPDGLPPAIADRIVRANTQ